MILGLTGFSGAGKSTVAELFKEHGFYHLDCDWLVHNEVYRDPIVLTALAQAFGPEVVKNGALDRPALRKCTMGNPAALKRLNQTVMPFILEHINQTIAAHSGENVIVDAPLLFESGLDRQCDKVLSVIADPQIALERIIRRDNLTTEEAKKRLASQHPAEYYTAKSDYILKNNGGIAALKEQTLELLQQLL